MENYQKAVIQYIQNDIKNMLDSGLITDPTAQYRYIDNLCKDLLLLNINSVTNAISNYMSDQNKIQDKLIEIRKKMDELYDEYKKNAQVIIEQIKKL